MSGSVAAGHAATAQVGAEILAEGGTAADAAVAASLASCVAETAMTGLLSGGFAIYFEAATRRVRNLDCFVAVPSGPGNVLIEVDVPFWGESVPYLVGPASFGVPGLAAGLDALWRSHGRLPWARLCEPALRLAHSGVELPPAHAVCLRETLAPVYTMNEGARFYSPGGKLLEAGDLVRLPGLVNALEALQEEGAQSVYRGTIAARIVELMEGRGGAVTADDLAAYEPLWSDPVEVGYCGTRFHTRAGLSAVPETLPLLPPLRGIGERARVLALLEALGTTARDVPEHTTNLCVADADGNVCRAHVEPRPVLWRLAPGVRPAPQLDPRREVPHARGAEAGRADGEHDGSFDRARRGRLRARDRLGRRSSSADGDRGRLGRSPRRRSRATGGRGPPPVPS